MPWAETELQRNLTIGLIQKRKLNAPAIWLVPEAAASTPEDAVKPASGLNTVLDEWRSPDDERNMGVRLTEGFLELRIRAPDDIWIKCLFAACASLRIDARFAYGVKGKPISSLILRVENPASIERWRGRWIRSHKDKSGQFVEAPFIASPPPTPKGKGEWENSRPLPGSRFAGDLVVWRPWGKPPAVTTEEGFEDLEAPREIAATDMESIARAIAFATLGYWIAVYLDGLTTWDEALVRAIGGWIARLIREGRDINARGKSLEGVCWSPIDDQDTARLLLRFLGSDALELAFDRADAALERNATAPIPGWGAIETLFGPTAKAGIRRAFRAGLDLEIIEQLSEQYVYDRTTHEYLDRDALLKGLAYQHGYDDLVHSFQNEPTFSPAGKPLNPFQLYAHSSLRNDVEHQEFRPGHPPGAVLRYSSLYGILGNEDRQPDEYRVLNIFSGFTVKPVAVIDQTIMSQAVSMLDHMLGLLTRDNDAQMWWIKKFIGWIVQWPEIKAQVCPVLIGGQGIGKSLLGNMLMRSLFGSMAATADASSLSENRFVITPFIGKLITFIDEVRLESVGAINTIKKFVREDQISGQKKFGHQRDYYIPSRLMIAANQPNIGLTPEDAADRALFFICSWTAENKRMTDREFQTWSLTLKPFYNTFVTALENVEFRRHLMRYFIDVEVTRAELEDLQHSSRDDENVVRATMSKAREVARAIVADARIISGLDITAWFSTASLRDAIKRVDGPRTTVEPAQVLMEYERAGVVETVRGDLRKFRWRYGTLIDKLGQAHGLPITNNWDYQPDDYGENDVRSVEGGPAWRGNRQRKNQQQRPPDPDYYPDMEEAPF